MSTIDSTRTTQLLMMPSRTTTDVSLVVYYTISLSGTYAEIVPLGQRESSNKSTMIKSSQPIIYREPIHIHEEIDTEEWKRSLTYNVSQVEGLLHKILVDFDLEPTEENMNWLKKEVTDLISLYEEKYAISLPDETRSMIKNLLVRMAYDKLCIKNPYD